MDSARGGAPLDAACPPGPKDLQLWTCIAQSLQLLDENRNVLGCPSSEPSNSKSLGRPKNLDFIQLRGGNGEPDARENSYPEEQQKLEAHRVLCAMHAPLEGHPMRARKCPGEGLSHLTTPEGTTPQDNS